MKRFYVFKDGTQQGSTFTRELAVDLIRQYQKLEPTPSYARSSASLRERKNLSPIPPARNRPGRNGAWNDKEEQP